MKEPVQKQTITKGREGGDKKLETETEIIYMDIYILYIIYIWKYLYGRREGETQRQRYREASLFMVWMPS